MTSTLPTPHFTFRRKQEAIATEARLDGIYVIRTNLPADKSAPTAEQTAAYKILGAGRARLPLSER